MDEEVKLIEKNLEQIIILIRDKLSKNGYIEERLPLGEKRSTPFIDKHIDFTKDDFTVRIKIYKITK